MDFTSQELIYLLIAIFATGAFLWLAIWSAVGRARALEALKRVNDSAALSAALVDSRPYEGLLVWKDDRAHLSESLRGRLGIPVAVSKIDDLWDTDGKFGISVADCKRLQALMANLENERRVLSLHLRLAGSNNSLAVKLVPLELNYSNAPVAVIWFDDPWNENSDPTTRGYGAMDAWESVDFPVWIRDPDLTLVSVNAAYANAVDQRSSDEIVGEQVELVEGPLSGSGRDSAKEAVKLGRKTRTMCNVVIGGERRAIEVVDIPLKGGKEGTIGYAIDRTDEEQIRAELVMYRESHNDTLDKLSTPVAIFSSAQNLEFFNSAFLALLHLDEAWLRSKPSHDEFLEALRENRMVPEQADFRTWKKAVLAQYTSVLELAEELWHLPDNRTLRVGTQPHPLGGLLVFYEDVTDRLALESSYNTLIAVQQETIENLHEGVAVIGADGRIKLTNTNYAKIWGLEVTDIRGEQHISDVLDKSRSLLTGVGEDWSKIRDGILAHTVARTPASGRWRLTDDRALEFATIPLPDGATLFTVVDVTAAQRVEQALRERTEALETADRLKSEFVANVSYELRTPLNSIIGFTELLSQQYFGALNDKQMEYSEAILSSSHLLRDLIDDILDLAVIEAGKAVLQAEEIDVGGLVRRVCSLAHDAALEKGVAIDVQGNPEGITMIADQRRLSQALYNVLSNAVTHSPPNSQVGINVETTADDVRISISDSGAGLDKEDQSNMFEKFWRSGHEQGGGAHTGMGLGLSLVRSFVALHGGDVEIDSLLEQGMRVTCRLPRVPPEANATEEQVAKIDAE